MKLLPMIGMAALFAAVMAVTQKVFSSGVVGILVALAFTLVVCGALLVAYYVERLPNSWMLAFDGMFTGFLGSLRRKARKRSKLHGFTPARAQAAVRRDDLLQPDLIDDAFASITLRCADRARQGVMGSMLVSTGRLTGVSSGMQALAAAVYGREADVVTIDCSTLAAGAGADLLASPDSSLVEEVRRDNEQVIVLDRIDAAFSDAHSIRALHALIHDGVLGGQAIASGCIVVATVTAGADAAMKAALAAPRAGEGDRKGLAKAVAAAVSPPLTDDLLRAFDILSAPRPLSNAQRAWIAAAWLDRVSDDTGVALRANSVEPAVFIQLVRAQQTHADLGAEAAFRETKRLVLQAVASGTRQGSVGLRWNPEADGGAGAFEPT